MIYLMLALLAGNTHGDFRTRPFVSGSSVPAPLFEFASASGAGMGTACSCSSVTGSLGEAVTHTRASSGACLKSTANGSISNTDLVTCAADQPRVMPGFGGDSVLGILVEKSATNISSRSEAIDNAIWSDVGAPTLNGANLGTAPNNTATAEDYTFGATGAGQEIGRTQSVTGCGGVGCQYSVFVKGVSAGGTLDVCAKGTTTVCSSCTFNSTAWTRCNLQATVAGTPGLFVGNSTLNNGGVSRASNRVFVWGAQVEVTDAWNEPSSYVATVAAAVARAEDSYLVTPPSGGSVMSMAATVHTNFTGHQVVLSLENGGNRYSPNFVNAGSGAATYKALFLFGSFLQGAGVSVSNGVHRLAQRMTNATTLAGGVDGVFADGTVTSYTPLVATGSTLYIGCYSGGYHADGVVKKVCLSTLVGGCL